MQIERKTYLPYCLESKSRKVNGNNNFFLFNEVLPEKVQKFSYGSQVDFYGSENQ